MPHSLNAHRLAVGGDQVVADGESGSVYPLTHCSVPKWMVLSGTDGLSTAVDSIRDAHI